MDRPIEVVREQVLKRDVPWESYMTAKLITGTDLQLLRRYDHKSKEVQSALIEEDGAAYIKTFLAVLTNVAKEETVEYTLALIHDLLSANPKRASLFHGSSVADEGVDIYAPFLKFISERSPFTQEAACRILTLIISERPKAFQSAGASSSSSAPSTSSQSIDSVLNTFVPWLTFRLSAVGSGGKKVPWLLLALSTVLREVSARQLFVETDGVKLLNTFITPASSQQNMQLLYQAVLCAWLLSFHEPAIAAMKISRTAPRIIDVAKATSKEKIVRVAVMTLNNLLVKGHMGGQLVEFGLPKVVQSLRLQAWHDEELKDVLESMQEGLRHNLKVLSSFDKYRQEILSGSLDWTPIHKDPVFWRENIMRFEDKEFEVLRVLVTLLERSSESKTLAVACHDLGQFIQAHPSGRNVALDMKAKEKVMSLMENADPDVRKQALLCVQKLLLSARYASYLQ